MSHDLRIMARTERKVENAPAKIKNKFTIQGGSKLEVFDEEGGKLYEGEFKSFTANFLKLLYGSMIGSGTAKAKDLTNTDLAMDAFPQSTFNVADGTDVKKFGVVVGTNTAAVSVSDYNITVPSGLTLNATAVSASSVGADSILVEISRQIGNTTGATVNLKEAGLICGSEDETDTNVLIARDLLDITLENGKKSVWRYTINFNFANNVGGFVKSFADKMFQPLFSSVTTNLGWASRSGYGVLSYNNQLWLFGGYDGNFRNDVWNSLDGITWTRVTSSASWTGRNSFGYAIHNGKMWIVGGNNGPALRDIYKTENGSQWTSVTPSGNYWSARRFPSVCSFQGKLWLMGGIDSSNNLLNDVWCSSDDGATWEKKTDHAEWAARRLAAVCVFDDKLWIAGGRISDSEHLNDVWNSLDGITWTRVTSSASWTNCNNLCVFRNKMWNLSYYASWTIDGISWYKSCKSARGNVTSASLGGRIFGFSTARVDISAKDMPTDLQPGSSSSSFSATGTALGSLIANGSGSGQLVYGAMPSAATTEPTTSGNKTTFSIAREFANNSGADITIREVGLFSGSDMLARLILAQPVTIANGSSEIITVDFETEV